VNKEYIEKILLVISWGVLLYFVLISINFSKDASVNSALLFSTMLALLWYTIETNKLQKTSAEQVELTRKALDLSRITLSIELIHETFRNMSTVIDAFIGDIDSLVPLLKQRANFRVDDIDNYFEVLQKILQKKSDQNYLKKQQSEFHELWEDLNEKDSTEKDQFILFLIEFKKEMSVRLVNIT
jgi:hypothetical protein